MTLLNVDYKIACETIAKIIEPILNKFVHPDQPGFVKGRYIRVNISDTMEQKKKFLKNRTGVLILIDFQKAFDSHEWSCTS